MMESSPSTSGERSLVLVGTKIISNASRMTVCAGMVGFKLKSHRHLLFEPVNNKTHPYQRGGQFEKFCTETLWLAVHTSNVCRSTFVGSSCIVSPSPEDAISAYYFTEHATAGQYVQSPCLKKAKDLVCDQDHLCSSLTDNWHLLQDDWSFEALFIAVESAVWYDVDTVM